MHIKDGDIIDERFEVCGTCSEAGGMGPILHVKDLEEEFENEIVLKYCREEDEEYIKIAHDHGKKIFMHSDGYILAIIPDLIEIFS